MAQDGLILGWDHQRMGDSFLGDQSEKITRVELWHDDQATVHQQGLQEHDPGAVAVERCCHQGDRLSREPVFDAEAEREVGAIVVGVNDALRGARGTGAVDDDALIRQHHPHGGRCRELTVAPRPVRGPSGGLESDRETAVPDFGQRCQFRIDDAVEGWADKNCPGAAVRHHAAERRRRGQERERDHHTAGPIDPQHDLDHFGAVAGDERDLVALRQPGVQEAVGDLVDPPVENGPGEASLAADHCFAIRVERRVAPKDVGQ